MRATIRWLLALCCVLKLFMPLCAWADPPDHSLEKPTKQDARQHLKQGNGFYNRAKWDDAIREYEAGAAVEDVPLFDYNLGQSFRLAGAYQAAILHYERFLDRGRPTGEVLAAVQGFIAEMRAQLANRARSTPPTEPAREPGEPTATPPAAPVATAAQLAMSEQSASVAEPNRGWRRLGWGLTATGLIGAGLTTWLMVSATGLDSDAKNAARPISERLDLQDRADSRRRTALIVGVSSGAAAVLGIVTLAIPARHSRSASATAWQFRLTGNGAAVFGRF
jgi:hypothetical protein